MKIAIIADGRSPTARSWIQAAAELGHEIHLISSYPCPQPEGAAAMTLFPLALGGMGRSSTGGKARGGSYQQLRLVLLKLRYYLGPLSIWQASKKYQVLIEQIQPDLVQALRIPYEGMLSAYTPAGIPVVVNSWGNDFTLHAPQSILMRAFTRRAVRRADGFSADCLRDIRLAGEWGLRPSAPTLFAPGNGGLDLTQVDRIWNENRPLAEARENGAVILNPRGIRPAYVCNDAFFRALPAVFAEFPQATAQCAGMKDQIDAVKWIKSPVLSARVELLGSEPQQALWQRMLAANLVVSPAIHDGTPNSVLEGMAYGCLPVVGSIESLREWITDGQNGLLVDPTDPASIAEGMIHGLRDRDLQQQAARLNRQILRERADRTKVIADIDRFYRQTVNK
jgi:glycosyltransferase involved in cell wall biosynthesis